MVNGHTKFSYVHDLFFEWLYAIGNKDRPDDKKVPLEKVREVFEKKDEQSKIYYYKKYLQYHGYYISGGIFSPITKGTPFKFQYHLYRLHRNEIDLIFIENFLGNTDFEALGKAIDKAVITINNGKARKDLIENTQKSHGNIQCIN